MSITITGAEKIDQSQLRVGDVIFPFAKNLASGGEVVEQVSDEDGDVETDQRFYSPLNHDFYLVKRAPLDLPDKVGSVVLVTTPSASEGVRWMLTASDIWVSAAGNRKIGVDFAAFAAPFDVEVIA